MKTYIRLRPYASLLFLLVAVVLVVLLPSVALAQTPSSPNMTAFAVLLPGVIALSTQVTTALRDALTSAVPPAGLSVPAKLRPWLAAGVGAIVAFLASLGAASATGGDMLSRTILLSAAGAALTNLGITLPKLIHAEATAVAISTRKFVQIKMGDTVLEDPAKVADAVKASPDSTTAG